MANSSVATSANRVGRNVNEAKRTGAHFTPPSLADQVARRLLQALPPQALNSDLEVLDPSCGDGELLRAFIEASPERARHRIKLVGIEDNDKSLQATRARLDNVHARYELLHADFLDVSEAFMELPTLAGVLFDSNVSTLLTQPDVIIANPPYVRTQILGAGRAQQLAIKYKLKGRVDLYHAFLIAMTDVLKPGGLLGVITSNRFLTIKSGERIREFLSARYDLLEVIDLGDTKLFSAAVLPAVLIARKRDVSRLDSSTPRFIRIYEESSTNHPSPIQTTDIYAALNSSQDGVHAVNGRLFKVASGTLKFGAQPTEPWRLTTNTETAWTQRIEASTPLRIGDIAKVRVGIKTTADKVFIRRDWDSLPAEQRPEDEVLHPLFTHHDAERWNPNKPTQSLLRILYTHEVLGGKRRSIDFARFPRAYKYLQNHRARLEGRTFVIEAGRQWYEIWVPQDPSAWKDPKLVFPDISVEPKFFFDDVGALVNGDCYWLTLPADQSNLLFLIQGIANSDVMAKYHDMAFQNKLYSGRRRFISQYVERYPIPDPGSNVAKDIIEAVKALNATAPGDRASLEHRLNKLVAVAFGVGG